MLSTLDTYLTKIWITPFYHRLWTQAKQPILDQMTNLLVTKMNPSLCMQLVEQEAIVLMWSLENKKIVILESKRVKEISDLWDTNFKKTFMV